MDYMLYTFLLIALYSYCMPRKNEVINSVFDLKKCVEPVGMYKICWNYCANEMKKNLEFFKDTKRGI